MFSLAVSLSKLQTNVDSATIVH